MLLWCCINTQYFDHDNSSSILQYINDKLRDLQKLLIDLTGILTLTFKAGTGGCGRRFASP